MTRTTAPAATGRRRKCEKAFLGQADTLYAIHRSCVTEIRFSGGSCNSVTRALLQAAMAAEREREDNAPSLSTLPPNPTPVSLLEADPTLSPHCSAAEAEVLDSWALAFLLGSYSRKGPVNISYIRKG